MNLKALLRQISSARLLVLLAAGFGLLLLLPARDADARPSKCFGKPVNKVVNGSNRTVRLEFRDVAWIEGDNVRVIGKPNNVICAGNGRQVVQADKGTPLIDAGPGNDEIVLHPRSVNAVVQGGLGNDLITGSDGHDSLYGSPTKVSKGVADRDVINGGGGNDKIYDYGGEGNLLLGEEGADKLYSLGNAVSELFGGNGSDKLFSNGGQARSGALEKLFGEQGNDQIRADQPRNNGPVYLDGGEGDDRMSGTPKADTIISNSGIKKIEGGGGDDLFISAGRGNSNFDGGSGKDTISFSPHTPSEKPGRITGVEVDLGSGYIRAYSDQRARGVENVIGSAFDDDIKGEGGSRIDGGLGENICSGGNQTNCNGNSPGGAGGSTTHVAVSSDGIPMIMGSSQADKIEVGFNGKTDRFEVSVTGGAQASSDCSKSNSSGSRISCPVDGSNLNGMLVYGDAGADRIELENSVPDTLTTTINGGTGKNVIEGGPSKDFISTTPGSAGSRISGNGGLDVLYAQDKVSISGGPGTDIFRVVDPCLGANLGGGAGTDSVVFAGAPRGVKASLAGRYAKWRSGGCAKPTAIGKDIEKLEGTDANDHLIVGKRNRSQQGRSVIFGRGGIDVLDAKNGSIDSVTVGAGGKKNKVIADSFDIIAWDYGFAGYDGMDDY